MSDGVNWLQVFGSWFQRSQMCSPASHYLVYSIIAWAVVVSAVGFYVWRRFTRTQPVKVVDSSQAGFSSVVAGVEGH